MKFQLPFDIARFHSVAFQKLHKKVDGLANVRCFPFRVHPILFCSALATFSAMAGASNVKLSFSGQVATVQWSGTPGVPYQVESASTPTGPWSPVDIPTTSTSVNSLAVQPSAFYRVAVFTNTPSYLANYSANINDTTPPTVPT